jgi:hypothetical protein
MDIIFIAALVAPLVALVERNHRRNAAVPGAPYGATDDRDLERVRHDLTAAVDAPARRLRLRRTSAHAAPAVCRPAAS